MYSGYTKPVKNEDPKFNRLRYIHKEGCECEHCLGERIVYEIGRWPMYQDGESVGVES